MRLALFALSLLSLFGQASTPAFPTTIPLPPVGASGAVIDGIGGTTLVVNQLDPATPASTLPGNLCGSFIAYDATALYTCGAAGVYVATPFSSFVSAMSASAAKLNGKVALLTHLQTVPSGKVALGFDRTKPVKSLDADRPKATSK